MGSTKAIVTGSVYTDESAIDWLRTHKAKTENVAALTVIILPEEARVEQDGSPSCYIIRFYGADGNDEPVYVEIYLDVDAYETELSLKGEIPPVRYNFVKQDDGQFRTRYLTPYSKEPKWIDSTYSPKQVELAHTNMQAKVYGQDIEFVESGVVFDSLYTSLNYEILKREELEVFLAYLRERSLQRELTSDERAQQNAAMSTLDQMMFP